MATEVFVGIDVSKDKVDVAAIGAASLKTVTKRTPKALASLAQKLCKMGVARVVLEASGGYERAVLDAIHEAELEVYLVQPRRARHFAKSLGRYAKTDAIDASTLAKMAEVALDDDLPWTSPAEDVERLRALVHRRDEIVAQIGAEKKRLRQARFEFQKKSIDQHLEWLQSERKKLEAYIEELGERSELLRDRMEELTKVDGVGVKTAAALLAELPELGSMSRNKIGALAGVAPITRESGTWSGRRYIHGGRTRARNALYMAALASLKHNAHLREYYDHLVSRGKPKMVALIATMRKLLIHLNARLRRLADVTERPPKEQLP